jgi:maltose O-acetyltransferase
MREGMLAGELHIADDPDLARDSARAQRLMHQINTIDPTDHGRRRELLTELLGGFGEGSEIRPPLHCDYGYQTVVGAGTVANFGLVVVDVDTVTIGDDVRIGPNVQLLTVFHPLEAGPRRDPAPIAIGDNVSLGGGGVAAPGADTVVDAGSVVLRGRPGGRAGSRVAGLRGSDAVMGLR